MDDEGYGVFTLERAAFGSGANLRTTISWNVASVEKVREGIAAWGVAEAARDADAGPKAH